MNRSAITPVSDSKYPYLQILTSMLNWAHVTRVSHIQAHKMAIVSKDIISCCLLVQLFL